MVLRPVGPLSPGVYWFRRLLVMLVVLVVVWAGYRWLGPGGDGSEAAGPGVAATGTPTPTLATPSVTPTVTPTTTKPTKKPSKSATPDLPDCADKDISLSVATDAESYPAGVQPQLTLTVRNDSDAACLRDLGPAALELRVSSGGARIWSSDDCNPGGGSDPTPLEPGTPFSQSVTWARVASQPGCPSGEPSADPGQYQVVARNVDLISEPAVFTLE